MTSRARWSASSPSLNSKGKTLLRVYFYDAPPATGVVTNPLDGKPHNLSGTEEHARKTRLLQALELQPDFALRSGETVVRGWELGAAANRSLRRELRTLVAEDLVPHIKQRGVDLRIGLDIARLSLRQLVEIIV